MAEERDDDRVIMSDELRERVRRITNQPGFAMETGRTWTGEPYIQLVAPSAGRGKPREKYLIIAPTLSGCFRALMEATREQ